MGYNLKQNADGSTSLVNNDSSDGIKLMPVPQMSAGAGVTGGTGTIYRSSVNKVGGIIQTKILIDLTGLDSTATLSDIIGVDSTTDPCHFGQVPSDIGTVLSGRVICLEAPAGGEVDIDIYAADEGTGVTDGLVTSLTETELLDAAADWTAGAIKVLTAFPSASQYLYLTTGTSSTPTAGTYTAGKFLIEMESYE